MRQTRHPRAAPAPAGFGARLRWWRERRGLSQLDLAIAAETTQRHLSFLESGRAMPSREMILRLAGVLGLPLRQQNAVFLAAGYAPPWRESDLSAPELARVSSALDFMLAQQEPYPAFVVDRRWNLLRANGGAGRLVESSPARPRPRRRPSRSTSPWRWCRPAPRDVAAPLHDAGHAGDAARRDAAGDPHRVLLPARRRHRPDVPGLGGGPQTVLMHVTFARTFAATLAFTREMGAAAAQRRLVQVPGVGLDRIDRAGLPAGARLANAYGHETGTAEFVLGAILSLTRSLPRLDAALRRGVWEC